MSVIGEICVSLDAMGSEQQAFLFAFLSSYPLALGGLLAPRGRRWAAMLAAAALLGFMRATDPWMHGVVVGVCLVVAMGLFIAMVSAMDLLPRLRQHPRVRAVPLQAELPFAGPDPAREREAGRAPSLPLTGRAGTT